MQHHLAVLLLTTALAPLAACGDGAGDHEPAGTARFADASAAQHKRAMEVARGREALDAQGWVWNTLGNPETLCPSVAWSGFEATATTDCSDLSDVQFSGGFVATNVWTPPDGMSRTGPAEIVFDDFVVSGVHPSIGTDLAIDGAIRETDAGLQAQYRSSLDGIDVTLDATWAGDDAVAGSTIEIAGLGTAEIRGSWDKNNGVGQIELHGADLFVLDFESYGAGGCNVITINGEAAGEVCCD